MLHSCNHELRRWQRGKSNLWNDRLNGNGRYDAIRYDTEQKTFTSLILGERCFLPTLPNTNAASIGIPAKVSRLKGSA